MFLQLKVDWFITNFNVNVHFEYSIQKHSCILNLKGFFIVLPLTTKIGEKATLHVVENDANI